jgi:hypothetical protein
MFVIRSRLNDAGVNSEGNVGQLAQRWLVLQLCESEFDTKNFDTAQLESLLDRTATHQPPMALEVCVGIVGSRDYARDLPF